MPRAARYAPGGTIFHVLNRRVDRGPLFPTEEDYVVFENLLCENVVRTGMRMCGHILMPNHWHLVLWPLFDGQMSDFMHRVELTHAVRWKLKYNTVGHGHLYQGRYKSFPVESDDHYLTVLRYVERNALRANLVTRAEDWRYSSLWRRLSCSGDDAPLLSPGPLELPDDWVEYVNEPQTVAELDALRVSIERGKPFGTEAWQTATARRLGLQSTMRPLGRPRKSK